MIQSISVEPFDPITERVQVLEPFVRLHRAR